MATDEAIYQVSLNAFEAGVLMGMIMKEPDHVKKPLSGVYRQLIDMKKQIEEAEGVTKKILPGGMLQITDRDGNTIIREPYPWEVEGN